MAIESTMSIVKTTGVMCSHLKQKSKEVIVANLTPEYLESHGLPLDLEEQLAEVREEQEMRRKSLTPSQKRIYAFARALIGDNSWATVQNTHM